MYAHNFLILCATSTFMPLRWSLGIFAPTFFKDATPATFICFAGACRRAWSGESASPFYFFKNALNKSIGSGRNVVVLCSLAISRMVWR